MYKYIGKYEDELGSTSVEIEEEYEGDTHPIKMLVFDPAGDLGGVRWFTPREAMEVADLLREATWFHDRHGGAK